MVSPKRLLNEESGLTEEILVTLPTYATVFSHVANILQFKTESSFSRVSRTRARPGPYFAGDGIHMFCVSPSRGGKHSGHWFCRFAVAEREKHLFDAIRPVRSPGKGPGGGAPVQIVLDTRGFGRAGLDAQQLQLRLALLCMLRVVA